MTPCDEGIVASAYPGLNKVRLNVVTFKRNRKRDQNWVVNGTLQAFRIPLWILVSGAARVDGA